MYLELDVAEAVARHAAGDLSEEASAAFASQIVSQAYVQNRDFIFGLPAEPSHRGWQQLARVQTVPRRGSKADQQFAALLQTQCLTVQVDDVAVGIPVRPILEHLPADHWFWVVELRDLPCQYVRRGTTEAILAVFGYDAASNVTVVNERAGVLAGGSALGIDVPVLNMIEAVVRVPLRHAGLARLPRAVEGLGWSARIVLRPYVFPPPSFGAHS
jgi:hypothetical protein